MSPLFRKGEGEATRSANDWRWPARLAVDGAAGAGDEEASLLNGLGSATELTEVTERGVVVPVFRYVGGVVDDSDLKLWPIGRSLVFVLDVQRGLLTRGVACGLVMGAKGGL